MQLLSNILTSLFRPMIELPRNLAKMPNDIRYAVKRIRRYPRRFVLSVIHHVLAIAVTFIFVYPLIWLVSSSLKPNWQIYREPLSIVSFNEIQTDVYEEIFDATPFPRYLTNSLVYSVVSGILTLAFATLASYGLSRHEFSGKNLLMVVILAIQLIPGLLSVIPLYILMRQIGLYNTQHGIIMLYSALQIPWAVWVMKGYFDTIPIELDEAARVDGASKLRALWQIILPLVVPGLAASFIIIFMGRWNEFALANALLSDPEYHPLTVGTFRLLGPDESDFRLTAAASLINIVPILLVFTVLQRFLVSGLAAGAVKQ